MIEAGLLIHGQDMHGKDIAVPYDRFRNRLMFPIGDRAGTGHRLRRAGAGTRRAI